MRIFVCVCAFVVVSKHIFLCAYFFLCYCSTFNDSNIFYLIEYGPIKEKTIYVLDPKTGAIKSGWGEDMFYMPHGLTIDVHGNYWITDVAMHQAFKVS